MIYVISQVSFITGLNPKFIKTGFFVVKDAGILFLDMIIIPMVVQERLTEKMRALDRKNNEIIRSLKFYSIK